MTDSPHDSDADDFIEAAADADPAAELERLRAENGQLKDQALRYAAEAENTRRRAEKDSNDARAFAIQRFARDLLGVADNLNRALAHAPRDSADPTVKTFVLGMELTEKTLDDAFERNGLKVLDPERGGRFDPHAHQAMSEQAADDVPPGAVVQTMQRGYELFGRVIRPAMVVTAPRGAAPAATADAQSAAQATSGYAPPESDVGRAFDAKA